MAFQQIAMNDILQQDAVAAPRVLVVFDYDWSLVNDNSDTLVFQSLCPDLLTEIAMRRRVQPSWTQLMDDLLSELVVRLPLLTQAQIQDAVAQVPVQPRMLDALRMAVDTYNADVYIISDANTVYIESMLAHHDLHAYVTRVVTNPAAFIDAQSNRLSVKPYHALDVVPHGCALCPTNMCKGRIVDAIRAETKYDRVLYVGDGGGDFCPATRLTSRDVVFARDDDADGKAYGLLKKLRAAEDTIHARVVPWRTGHDIYEQFSLALAANKV